MTAEDLKARIRKLSLRATDAKMALHDLSEELPTDWRRIPEVAQAAFDAHAELDAARKALKALESA